MTAAQDQAQMTALEEHIEILSGYAFDSKLFSDSGGTPLVRIRDVVRGHTYTNFKGHYEKKFLIEQGDLLVGMDGDFNREVWDGAPALLNQRVCKITARPESLDQRYLYHFLPKPLMDIWHQTPFATVKHLSARTIKSILISLPPLDEQRRIAAILDNADELRAKRRQALAHLDTLTQSIFHSMFGDVTSTATLGQLCMDRFRNGVSPSTRGSIKQRVLTLSAVTGASFDPTSVKMSTFEKPIPDSNRVSLALLLICRGNGNRSLVGKGYFPRADLLDVGFPDTVIAAQPNLDFVVPLFLEAAWNRPQARNQLEAAAKTTNGTFKINQSSLAGIRLPVPPLELQQTFATRVAAVERLKETHRKHLAELDALFASLQHRAFR